MSEISWLRERAAAMRVAMYSSDMSDAIDTVLDHLASVEVSRIDALARVAVLERENVDLANACEHMRDEIKEGLNALEADHEAEETVAEAVNRRLKNLSELKDWRPTSKRLPDLGKYVLARHNRGTWEDSTDQSNVNCVVVKRMQCSPDAQDEWEWRPFGPGVFSCREITYWLTISDQSARG